MCGKLSGSVARVMIMTKPAKLLASALLCAALGFPQPANAITINFDGGTAEVTCMAAGVVSPAGPLIIDHR